MCVTESGSMPALAIVRKACSRTLTMPLFFWAGGVGIGYENMRGVLSSEPHSGRFVSTVTVGSTNQEGTCC